MSIKLYWAKIYFLLKLLGNKFCGRFQYHCSVIRVTSNYCNHIYFPSINVNISNPDSRQFKTANKMVRSGAILL